MERLSKRCFPTSVKPTSQTRPRPSSTPMKGGRWVAVLKAA
jgi:hypothetical protein